MRPGRHLRARPSLRPAGGWPWGRPARPFGYGADRASGSQEGAVVTVGALRAPPFDKLRTWLQVRASAACLAKAETCAKARNAGLKHRRGRRERPAGWAGLVTHLAHRVKRHRRSAKRAERASAHIACRYGPRSESGRGKQGKTRMRAWFKVVIEGGSANLTGGSKVILRFLQRHAGAVSVWAGIAAYNFILPDDAPKWQALVLALAVLAFTYWLLFRQGTTRVGRK